MLPTFFVFFVAGKLITTSIDDWFHARIDTGLQNGLELHNIQTRKIKNTFAHNASTFVQNISETDLLDKEQLAALMAQIKMKNPVWKEGVLDTCYIFNLLGTEKYNSFKNEIDVWRSYRKINNRTTGSLKNTFLHTLQSINSQGRVFDFYGSMYWACNKNKHYFVFARRYPPHIRYPLIEIETSLHD